jgi:uncharacterized protein (UPF0218 family)
MDTEFTITVDVSIGAGGTEFAARLLDAIEKGESVYMQVAGEYGHLRVEALRDFDTGKTVKYGDPDDLFNELEHGLY